MSKPDPALGSAVEACLSAAATWNDRLHAMITPMPETARAQIAAGLPMGALHGMAVSVKDNIDTAGTRTTRGSAFFADHVPDADAPVVTRLKAAGAVIVGKDNMHEFAFGGTTQNPHHGLGRNPWNTGCIPGGSSGGSGISVAAGFAEAALGTDTGGSVRCPAALNGISGLRPTVGRVPNSGTFPVSARFDTIGPLARTAATVGDVYETIAGFDAADPLSIDRPVESWRAAHARGFSGLRIGLPAGLMQAESTPEVIALVRAAAARFGDLGMSVADFDHEPMDEMNRGYMVLVQADAAMVHRERMETAPERFGADVSRRLGVGGSRPIQDYAQALYAQFAWMRQLDGLFGRFDVFMLPTIGFGAPLASDAPDMMAMTHRLTRMTAPWSYGELPGLSVPCGMTEAGLPVSLQIVGPKWSEARLIALGASFQQMTGFHLARPVLA